MEGLCGLFIVYVILGLKLKVFVMLNYYMG